jgi:hypothetical protein
MHFAPAREVLNLTEAHRNVVEKAVAKVQERVGRIERAFEEHTNHYQTQERERLIRNGAISIRTCGPTD